jgi:DNA-binding transcriptional LysR family regulator
MVTSARLSTPGLEVARLHQEEYAFVGAKSLIDRQPFKRPEDARLHTLLDVGADLPLFRYFVDARPAHEAWIFERAQYLGGIGPIRVRALEGAGVAVLPIYYNRDDLKRGRLRRLFPGTKLPSDWFRLIWRKNDPQAGRARALAAELAKLPLR